jgi:hypothetical protein
VSDDPPETTPGTADDFEERFASALNEAHERNGAEGSWAAIQNWNEWVARNGLRLEEYLRRIGRRGRAGR